MVNDSRSLPSSFVDHSPYCALTFMMKHFALGLLLSFSSMLVMAQTEDRPTIRVGGVEDGIAIDGVLDESAWLNAESTSDLFTTEPVEGGTPSGKTTFSVIAEPRNLIIGVKCEYAEGNKIVSFSKLRDADLDNEDHVRVVIDPFLDGLSGYIFMVNANGARYDALVANRGEDENSNWDAIWDARTTLLDNGWSVEIRIPMQSINFKKGLDKWGFNIERRIQENQETIRWANAKIDQWFIQTSKAGFITDVPEFSYGWGLNIRPSLIAEMSRVAGESAQYDLEPSIEVLEKRMIRELELQIHNILPHAFADNFEGPEFFKNSGQENAHFLGHFLRRK